jgi:hypothetical protein
MAGNPFPGPGNVRKRTAGVKKNGWVFDKPEAAVIKDDIIELISGSLEWFDGTK